MFPPRERGWSQPGLHAVGGAPVSPARAGMVRSLMFVGMRGKRFPRASGDGPYFIWLRDDAWRFPPRERGWSPKAGNNWNNYRVSPARAGMVPGRTTQAVQPFRFPRASGDGPPAWCFYDMLTQFPPRERGWSQARRSSIWRSWVSPARAGMVPKKAISRHLLKRFPPRERGWSQFAGVPERGYEVSPARAGMVPVSFACGFDGLGFPRASGDGPALGGVYNSPGLFPPRERGWSLEHAGQLEHAGVSPARAGMVRM